MNADVLAAMREAGEYFVDIVEFRDKACAAIAAMTGNEAAFVSSGAGACVVLAAASLICGGDPALIAMLPDASKCEKNEIIVFASQTEIPMLPYWRIIGFSGARIVKIADDLDSLRKEINGRTAGVFFFLADLYEAGLPRIEEIIQVAHERNVQVIIDAAAQLPPKANLWHYTRDLGADGIIFSGGKYIMGPQSTGLFLGRSEIVRRCAELSNPNCHIGRPYKVGKEEYAAFYAAIKHFVEADEDQAKATQHKHLDYIEDKLADCSHISIKRVNEGRLGQDAPRLLIDFLDGRQGCECARFMYEHCDPAIDIGYFRPNDPSGNANQIFVNSINLREHELPHIVHSIQRFLAL